MQYDVFISCKSEDYQSAEVIYKFLEANGIHPFLASIELRKLGESEYRKAISEALKSSYHMIVFASKAEYIDSKWVYYEWDWFVTAKLKGIKPGQIVTFLKDVNINDVNADLWKYESFTFDNYKEKLLYYVETPEYQQRKEQERLENERKRQIIAEQERAEKAEQERIKTLQTQKDALTRRLTLSIGKVNREMKEMIDLDKKLGTEFDGWNKCPICGDDRRDSNCEYCETCGWFFVTPKEYLISKEKENYKERLQLSEYNWQLLQKHINDGTDTKHAEEKQNEIDSLQKELKERLDQLNLANKQIANLQKEFDKYRSDIKKEEKVQSSTKKNDNHEYVDLGLSVKWATCNVGATKPEEYGDYFAWGETEPKKDYSWGTYKWCKGSRNTLTKYCTNKTNKKGSSVSVDKTVLALQDDVAHVKWGGKWRMPTKEEFKELCEKCTWEWKSLNGVVGHLVTGPNGNSIFLPAAGYRDGTDLYYRGLHGYYWSATLLEHNSGYACTLYFRGGSSYWNVWYDRYYGFSVRPVTD